MFRDQRVLRPGPGPVCCAQTRNCWSAGQNADGDQDDDGKGYDQKGLVLHQIGHESSPEFGAFGLNRRSGADPSVNDHLCKTDL